MQRHPLEQPYYGLVLAFVILYPVWVVWYHRSGIRREVGRAYRVWKTGDPNAT